jgi:hypothetical protein
MKVWKRVGETSNTHLVNENFAPILIGTPEVKVIFQKLMYLIRAHDDATKECSIRAGCVDSLRRKKQ